MLFMNLTKVVCLLSVAGVSGGSALGAQPAAPVCTCASDAPDYNFTAEASQLLEEIRADAHRLSRNAANVRSFGPGGVNWQGHAHELTQVREHVNAAGKRIQRLQAIRHVLAPWQQEAVDSVTPMAVTLAARTQAAIRYLNENRTYLWSETYQDHLKTLSTRADQMKESVGVHLELARTQEKLEVLRDRVASIS